MWILLPLWGNVWDGQSSPVCFLQRCLRGSECPSTLQKPKENNNLGTPKESSATWFSYNVFRFSIF